MSRARTMVAALATALLVAGCASSGGSDEDSGGAGGATPAPQSAGGSPPPDEPVAVAATVWHAGFEIELTGGVLSTVEEVVGFGEMTWRRVLEIDARLTNHGPDQTSLRSEVTVVGGSDSFPPSQDSELAPVPSGLTGEARFVFEVADEFDLTSAYVQFGRSGNNQARVPLGPQGGELVDLAPQELAVASADSITLLDLDIVSGHLRADVPPRYEQVAEGRLALTLDFTVTSRRGGNWSLHPQDFALVLPNGNAVGVDGYRLGSVTGNDSGVFTDGLYVRFIVSDPPAGGYTLRYTVPSWFHEDGDPDEMTITFTL